MRPPVLFSKASVARTLTSLLDCESSDIARLLPFFGLYGLIFILITMGNVAVQTLFVKKVGVAALPRYYGYIAMINLAAMMLYWWVLDRVSSRSIFITIVSFLVILTFGSWLSCRVMANACTTVYGVLFIGREVASSMILLHFGNFLQQYLSKAEMSRTLPAIYSGGRLGGMVCAALMGLTTPFIAIMDYVGMVALLGLVAMGYVVWLDRSALFINAPISTSIAPEEPVSPKPAPVLVASNRRFWVYMASNPIILWMSIATFLFIMCRWFVNYQYNHVFDAEFATTQAFGQNLSWITSGGLVLSLLLQVGGVTRLVKRFSLGPCFWAYHLVMMVMMAWLWLSPSLLIGVASRFFGNEIRLGFRNPLSLLITNQYPRQIRPKARTFSLGMVIPLGTLLASWILVVLTEMPIQNPMGLIGAVACGFGVLLLVSTFLLSRALNTLKV
ncbi:MAG: hypothetical protein KC475_09870 [Cyanobacteria bacterium HKST-UBA03]|nr:hypothetical protein [Cyanobacteria bacterium HKST-UBA03]